MLQEELGDAVDWYYVPGNHEVMGGSIDGFMDEFGPAQRTFDHRGTRFITLDTSSPDAPGRRVRADQGAAAAVGRGGRGPVGRLGDRSSACAAARPDPQQASQLTDRKEAALLEKWLADFRKHSGKGALFIGAHVGVFDASRVDGVPYLVNGNSGKAPAAPPGEGGFTGWSLLGVDEGAPRHGEEWVAAQTRAHVDGLTLAAPAELEVGESARASGEAIQGEGESARRVPVGWPLSADWSGSGGLCVVDGASKGSSRRAGKTCSATYDSRSGALTAQRPGTVTLTVEVNGEQAERQVKITQ